MSFLVMLTLVEVVKFQGLHYLLQYRGFMLKTGIPDWHFDPPTIRQLKVLRFFCNEGFRPTTKGAASGLIGRIFSDAANKHLWAVYVYTTGDDGDESVELRPHDRAALALVSIPSDWQPKHSRNTLKRTPAAEELIANILRDGSPFDDPPPKILISGTVFCFTGKFDFGSRAECWEAVVNRGGLYTDNVTSKTDVLVIGNSANPMWANDTYGRKIEAAMIRKIQRGNLNIIHEAYWKYLLND